MAGKFWSCGCSKKVFGKWREVHADVKSCPYRNKQLDRRVEWSRARDPCRARQKHYYQNKRRWSRINDSSSRYFGDWTYWTDRTEVSKAVSPGPE